jgi:F0F1-type ATP synthase membrane subunit b/b'
VDVVAEPVELVMALVMVELEFRQQSHHLLLVNLRVQLSSTLEEAAEELTKIQDVAAEAEAQEKAAEAEAEIDTQEDLNQNKVKQEMPTLVVVAEE